MRACEICRQQDSDLLHRQEFVSPDGGAPAHYEVACCSHCGFVFARDIAQQSTQDIYYSAIDRHQHLHVPDGLRQIHADFLQILKQALPDLRPEHAILDVGCGGGHFLDHCQRAGFRRLRGIEPSRGAAAFAGNAYGIRVDEGSFFDQAGQHDTDLLVMNGVLEHIVDLNAWIGQAKTFLKDGAHVFISVPNAERFASPPPVEPFLEFASEHINFFTGHHLDALMQGHGLRRVFATTQWNDLYRNHYLIAVYCLSGRTPPVAVAGDNGKARAAVEHYIELSQAKQSALAHLFRICSGSGRRIAIWGTGSLTARLWLTTPLADTHPVAFIDQRAAAFPSGFLGIPVQPPEMLAALKIETVIISSYVYREDIRKQLIDTHRFAGEIITLP